MNEGHLAHFIPLIGCALIIFVHVDHLAARPGLQISRAAGHKFFISAYLIFAFHYLTLMPGA